MNIENKSIPPWLDRAGILLGQPVMEALNSTRVILFGVGGVGSWCAEALIRTGLGHLDMVDSDVVCATNINRQLQALSVNTGKSKVEELKQRLLQINPEAKIKAHKVLYDENSCDRFDLHEYDYVIDAIDSLKNKILLLDRALNASGQNGTGHESKTEPGPEREPDPGPKPGPTVFASMGAASRLDPTRIKVSRLSKTSYCPLARRVRRGLRDLGQKGDPFCVYSDEYNLCEHKAKINGSLVHITATFGFTLASLVIQDVLSSQTFHTTT